MTRFWHRFVFGTSRQQLVSCFGLHGRDDGGGVFRHRRRDFVIVVVVARPDLHPLLFGGARARSSIARTRLLADRHGSTAPEQQQAERQHGLAGEAKARRREKIATTGALVLSCPSGTSYSHT